MNITIFQGSTAPVQPATITVVIDVIRAFTVAHYAFLQGIQKIFPVETTEQAFEFKKNNPELLLAGEEKGLAIEGFDLDNSPASLQQRNLAGKILVQKTTNGVRATLNCLESEHLFVTGFSNARKTATFIKEQVIKDKKNTVHLIASHPTGDDDLACAEYMKSILEDNMLPSEFVRERIKHAHVAKKFFEKNNPDFLEEDLKYCMKELDTDFVMKVNKKRDLPMIERINV